MTWYANYILAEPTPATINKFCTVPEISKGLYVVRNLDNYVWFDEKVCHGLPPGGLLVGREVCNLDSHAAEWHRDEAISWNAFIGPENVEVIEPSVVIVAVDDELEKAHLKEALPPIAFLRFLKWVNLTTSSVVSFYYCATWGGDTEEEFAWVFSENDKVYRFKDYENTEEYKKDGSVEVIAGAVLNLILSHHRLELPSKYFALCSRSFKWERHRVKCE